MTFKKVNRLPMLTYRYLKTNESDLPYRFPERAVHAEISDMTYVKKGGEVPENLSAASEGWQKAAESGERFTVDIPDGAEAELTISVRHTAEHPDYAGLFLFRLGQNAKLHLVWDWKGRNEPGAYAFAARYDLAEGAQLHASLLSRHLKGTILCDQREVHLADRAKAVFASGLLGGETVIVHSRGYLSGKEADMHEYGFYAAAGTQNLDLFYHIDHIGEDTRSNIDVKGALAGTSRKMFRGTIDFKRGCAGAEGSEGDYAIQLSPKTKNISLPLLLCTEDNVVGNHASSAGQIDENTVYYLMSRGFTYEEARRIVVESLIRPLVDQLDHGLQEEALQMVRRTLDAQQGGIE